jgi:hypothetical protein
MIGSNLIAGTGIEKKAKKVLKRIALLVPGLKVS